ncbi:colorectal cancer associated 2 [Hippocampus zosterae]|uniref:colorectal cancer associated 2 n=1 Tax=Hippocampus zosterae TaxID=109293 RepID=UPI00223D4E4B|nr:colorectal cancer associated 2 [Hippocampus zosterae]
MSDKPRVYQGVRVKTTVKELLQRHRAREANRKKVKTIPQDCLDLQGLCASPFSSNYVDPPTTPNVDPVTCGSAAVQPRPASFIVPDKGCSIQATESGFPCSQQPFGDMMVPPDCFSGNNIPNNSDCCYNNISMPLPPSLPLPWSHGLPLDSDNYGHGLVPCSSPESLKLCSPADHNSYSPQDSFSSSSSSCIDSPTRMECNVISYSTENYHNQNCTLQDSDCMPQCWANLQESICAPEYSPYYPPTDYTYPCLMEDYFKSNLALGTEMCYNVL